MSSTSIVFDPQGVAHDVPYEKLHDAIKNGGGVPGVLMTGSDGQTHAVPANRIQEAYQNGGKLLKDPIHGGFVPDAEARDEFTKKLSDQYAQSMQLAAGFGGAGNIAGKVVQGAATVAANPEVRANVGKVAKAASEVVSPDITGIWSPRLANAQRALGGLAEHLQGKEPVAPPASDPQAMRDWWQSRSGGLADQPVDRQTMQGGPTLGQKPQTPLATQEPLQKVVEMPKPAPVEPAPPKTPTGTSGLPKPASDAIDQLIPPENKALNMQVKSKVQFYLNKGDLESAQAVIENAAAKVPARRATNYIDNNTPAVQAGAPEGTSVPQNSTATLDALKRSLEKVKAGKVRRAYAAD